MKLKIENYQLGARELPAEGQCVIGQQQGEDIVVYQAYNPSIAEFAVRNQYLGGPAYSYNRMSWIKPNFLWMMYRCGWCEKPNQERVLAIWIKKNVLEDVLAHAVMSSFDSRYYPDHDSWKRELEEKEVRLQWDPDHDPYGNKLRRRAIQLGMKGAVLEDFGKRQIVSIEDITDFVKEQKRHLDGRRLELLQVPVERVVDVGGEDIKKRLGIDK